MLCHILLIGDASEAAQGGIQGIYIEWYFKILVEPDRKIEAGIAKWYADIGKGGEYEGNFIVHYILYIGNDVGAVKRLWDISIFHGTAPQKYHFIAKKRFSIAYTRVFTFVKEITIHHNSHIAKSILFQQGGKSLRSFAIHDIHCKLIEDTLLVLIAVHSVSEYSDMLPGIYLLH